MPSSSSSPAPFTFTTAALRGLLSLLPLLSPPSHAFVTRSQPPPPSPRRSSSSSSSSSSSLPMCICINCARVTNCAGYKFVEDMHGQPHLNPSPTFEPRNGSPTVNVNFDTVMSDRATSEYERMLREHKEEERKAESKARERGEGGASCEVGEDGMPLYGEKKYDLSPVTILEYDVVACEDFVEEVGCWVKNMPEEIRRANPDFVPT